MVPVQNLSKNHVDELVGWALKINKFQQDTNRLETSKRLRYTASGTRTWCAELDFGFWLNLVKSKA